MSYKQLPLFPNEVMDKLVKQIEDGKWDKFIESTKGATWHPDQPANALQPGKKKPRKKRSNGE